MVIPVRMPKTRTATGKSEIPSGTQPVRFYPLGVSARATAAEAGRAQVIVYYANETTKDVGQSENYVALRRILQSSSHPRVQATLEAIDYDAEQSSRIVERDIPALIAIAARLGFDLYAFSNSLAVKGEYIFFDHRAPRSSSSQLRKFPLIEQGENIVYANSPLSNPKVLTSALEVIGQYYRPGTLDLVLLLNTHGTREMAIIPRVTADFTEVPPQSVIGELTGAAPNDLAISWLVYQGTSKLEFWRVIARFSERFGAVFSTVFLESCESAPCRFRSWRQSRLLSEP